MTDFSELAPAKVNLSLHVGPVKANGRHDLVSLVCFAGSSAADTLIARPAEHMSLVVDGPFAGDAGPVQDNLVLAAANAMMEAYPETPPLAFTLTKTLPCAAGIGGGSADAAAALRLIHRAAGNASALDMAKAVAPRLGGDVLACLYAASGVMRGEGEIYQPLAAVPRLPALLVNPGVPCPTGPVFRHFDEVGSQMPPHPMPRPQHASAPHFIDYLKAETTNSLEAPAIALVPEIGETLDTLGRLPGAQLARMSGSGATCFAVFDTIDAATRGAKALKTEHPDWWFAATWLGA